MPILYYVIEYVNASTMVGEMRQHIQRMCLAQKYDGSAGTMIIRLSQYVR